MSKSISDVEIVAQLRAGVYPLGEGIAWRMREAIKLYTKAIEDYLAPYNLTYGEWRCLRALWEQDGLSQKELGDKLDMTSASTVFSVNLLERDRLARRVQDRADKRRLFVHLTKRGMELRDLLLPVCRDLNTRLVADFTDNELIGFSDLLDRLKGNLTTEVARGAKLKPLKQAR